MLYKHWTSLRLRTLVFCLASSCAAATAKPRGYCNFPDFLRDLEPSSGDDLVVWTTRARYDGVTGQLTKAREVIVKATQMTFKVISRDGSCVPDAVNNSAVPCTGSDVEEKIICLSEEAEEKFRVQIRRDGKSTFGCWKFVKRNKNVVQVWSARESKVNEDMLCYDASLDRDPWPWTANVQQEWVACPITGGFDFRAFVEGGKRQLCRHQPQPSRVESECMLGEGLQFHFPDSRCSFFPDGQLGKTFSCWGHWIEEDNLFVILGDNESAPRYTLRLPRDAEITAGLAPRQDLTAFFYLNSVCPMRGKGRPPGGVQYTELKIHRSDTGVCYDKSEQCEDFVAEGKCTNSVFHKYANLCKKSCGFCGQVPSARSECHFPRDWQGDWLWYEKNHVADVTIVTGRVSFSHLGSFVCKGKHWAVNSFKMFSSFSNGCRPRYTCIHFRKDGHLLKFQMSKSVLSDRSFDMCQFEDDTLPLGDMIRSSRKKILLPKPLTTFDSCQLFSENKVNVTFSDGSSCGGSMSDCGSRALLSLSLYPCPAKGHWREYSCVSYTKLAENHGVLVTEQKPGSGRFQCWVIRTRPEGTWEEATVLESGQCGDEGDFMRMSRLPDAVLSLRHEQDMRMCHDHIAKRPSTEETERREAHDVAMTTHHTLGPRNATAMSSNVTKYNDGPGSGDRTAISDTSSRYQVPSASSGNGGGYRKQTWPNNSPGGAPLTDAKPMNQGLGTSGSPTTVVTVMLLRIFVSWFTHSDVT